MLGMPNSVDGAAIELAALVAGEGRRFHAASVVRFSVGGNAEFTTFGVAADAKAWNDGRFASPLVRFAAELDHDRLVERQVLGDVLAVALD